MSCFDWSADRSYTDKNKHQNEQIDVDDALCFIGQNFYGIRFRNNYRLYEYLTYVDHNTENVYCHVRGVYMPRNMPMSFPRANVIIDRPPLWSKVPAGTAVLAPLGTDKSAQIRYAPVKVIEQKENDQLLVQPVCYMDAIPVGVEDGYVHEFIPDEYLTASSVRGSTLTAHMGRLWQTDPYKWCPDPDEAVPWLQVDMIRLYYICVIRVTGYTSSAYVTTFKLAVYHGGTFVWVLENGSAKVFQRITGADASEHLVNLVETPYRYVRFHPVTSNGAACMGVELYGYGELSGSGLLFPLREIRMTGSVCNLQTDCDRIAGAECARELGKPGTYSCSEKPPKWSRSVEQSNMCIHGDKQYPWEHAVSMDTSSIHGHKQYPWTQAVSMDTSSIHGDKQYPWTQAVSMETSSIHGHKQYPLGQAVSMKTCSIHEDMQYPWGHAVSMGTCSINGDMQYPWGHAVSMGKCSINGDMQYP
ncbi:predicted protein [Nematostella vectensis]|uniref:F5/8 type C domain-containing protein n=1 Tax=Nematostella vectensis TaxID=45351 RepID=A7S4F3_NEMVE|nr:predicted protein [Nematostella vectensis]|eukprot:XP_001633444.1 predicted protein [Nematostella vectensis]